tara:strand:+ start:2502 stop:3233 length:732 start_codon:yes stop_codon:yes gene_type:complete
MSDITVILNCFRRPEYLEEQIEAIRSQSVKPAEIWLWINHHPDNESFNFEKLSVDKIVKSSHNFKFHGRFALANLVKTKYVVLFDDDTIPGSEWFKNCVNTMDELGPCILGGVGVRLEGPSYRPHTRIGWSHPNESIEQVDLAGHCWFFPSNVMRVFWNATLSLDNCEDMQLSYAARMVGLKTYVPPHPKEKTDMWSSTKGHIGEDSKASSKGANGSDHYFYMERDACINQYLNNGWSLVKDA